MGQHRFRLHEWFVVLKEQLDASVFNWLVLNQRTVAARLRMRVLGWRS
jgi:hypothetical protein